MPRPMRTQPRDIDFLADLGRCGVMDRRMIRPRHYPTQGDRVHRRRIAQLEGNGLIQRVLISDFHAQRRGRLPSIFVLTDKGADLVYRFTGTRPRPLRPNLNPFTIWHRLDVARLQLAVLDAAAHHGLNAPLWINEWATIPGSKRGDSFARRFVLYESFDAGPEKSLSCRPDAACRIDYRGANLVAYWERDRSTETITQFVRKVPGYAALHRTKRYGQHFPGADRSVVRVYVVGESQQRIDNIRDALHDREGAELFRFACANALTPEHLLSASNVWQNAGGEFAPLLRGLEQAEPRKEAVHA